MRKEKVLTFNGALNYLKISNKTFYDKYRRRGLKAVGKKGKAYLYKKSDIDEITQKIEEEKLIHEKFEIIA